MRQFLVLLFCVASIMLIKAESIDGRPNVLFIAVDDMKDWVNCLGGDTRVMYILQTLIVWLSGGCFSPTLIVYHQNVHRLVLQL